MASFTFNTTRNPLNGKRERKTISSTALGITSTVYTIQPSAGATRDGIGDKLATAAVVQVLTEGINWTIDGTTPTAALGFNSNAGDFIYLDSAMKVKNFLAIREAANDASIEVVALFGA
jgi:hypothetical protein